jgi:hypothetical protein
LFVDRVFAKMDGGIQENEAFVAIKGVLGQYIDKKLTFPVGNKDELIRLLVNTITTKYPKDKDKFFAFIEDVQIKTEYL